MIVAWVNINLLAVFLIRSVRAIIGSITAKVDINTGTISTSKLAISTLKKNKTKINLKFMSSLDENILWSTSIVSAQSDR